MHQVVTGSCCSFDTLQALVVSMLESAAVNDPQVQLSTLLQLDQWLVSNAPRKLENNIGTDVGDRPVRVISAQQLATCLSMDKAFVRHLQCLMRKFADMEQLVLVVCDVMQQICRLHKVFQVQMGELEIWHELQGFAFKFPQHSLVQHKMWQTLAVLVAGDERNAYRVLQNREGSIGACGARFVFVREACDAIGALDNTRDLHFEIVFEIVRFLSNMYANANVQFAVQDMVVRVWKAMVVVMQRYSSPTDPRDDNGSTPSGDLPLKAVDTTFAMTRQTQQELLLSNCLRLLRLLIRKDKANARFQTMILLLFATKQNVNRDASSVNSKPQTTSLSCSTSGQRAPVSSTTDDGTSKLKVMSKQGTRRFSISGAQRVSTRKITEIAGGAPTALTGKNCDKYTFVSDPTLMAALLTSFQCNASLLVDLMAVFTELFAVPSQHEALAEELESRFHFVTLLVQAVKPKLAGMVKSIISSCLKQWAREVADQVLCMEFFRLVRQLSSLESVRKNFTSGFLIEEFVPVLLLALDLLITSRSSSTSSPANVAGKAGSDCGTPNSTSRSPWYELELEVLVCVEHTARCVAQFRSKADQNAAKEVLEQLVVRLRNLRSDPREQFQVRTKSKAKLTTKPFKSTRIKVTKVAVVVSDQHRFNQEQNHLLTTSTACFVLEQQWIKSLTALEACK